MESFGPSSEYEARSSANPEGSGDGEEEVEEEVEYVTLEISGIADVDPGLLTSYRLIVSSRERFRTHSISGGKADLCPLPCFCAGAGMRST